MKAYTSRGYTFTEDELQGTNPYMNPDGTIKDGQFALFLAWMEANRQYRLDQMSPEEREATERMYRHKAAKMQAGY